MYSQPLYHRAVYGMSLFSAKGCITSDGGFVMMGQKYSNVNDEDIFLVKLSENGDTLWSRTYLYPNGDDQAGEVLQTNDGGFFIVGWNYVMKTDSVGMPLWSKRISFSNSSLGKTALETPFGELVIASRGRNSSWGEEGVQLTKLDSAGNLIFNKLIGIFQGPYPYSIKNTSDGGYVISGETNYSASTSDAFLMKTDSAGNVSWAHHYGGNDFDMFWSVEETVNGDFLAIGGTANPQETFMVKVDSAGSLIWSRIYQSGFSLSMGYRIIRTSDQNFVFCGQVQTPQHSSILGKMDENGTVLWTKAYHPGNVSNGSRFYGVYETADSCLIATGFYIEIPWNGFNYIVKCDSAGNSNCYSNNIAWTSTPFVSKDSAIVCITASNTNIYVVTILTDCFCDSTNFICTGSVGLSHANSSSKDLIVYPNPFSDKLIVELNNSEVSEILLYDAGLRELMKKEFTNSTSLNVEQLAKGIYIYIVRNNSGLFLSGKIIKD